MEEEYSKGRLAMRSFVATDLYKKNLSWSPCGSRVTCDPPVMDTDMDILLEPLHEFGITEDIIREVMDTLVGLGFISESTEYDGTDFMSFRQDEINVIFALKPEFAERHHAATNICKTLNILHKPHRIMVFQGVLYGNRHWQRHVRD